MARRAFTARSGERSGKKPGEAPRTFAARSDSVGSGAIDDDIVIDIQDLSVSYGSGPQAVRAVRSVSLSIRRGEVLGLAGESGSGKSTLAFALTHLLRLPGHIVSGSVLYHDGSSVVDLAKMRATDLQRYRWEHIAVVFQSAMNALSPVLSIGAQLKDVLKAHRPDMTRAAREQRSVDLLATVGIPADRLSAYPHELSGGMRQRAMIAMALALDPEVIVMDEPTTALDVVTQRSILEEIARLQHARGFTVVFITHDLSLLLEFANRVAIMYAGRIVELATVASLLGNAQHPYTRGLFHSFPSVSEDSETLEGIPGFPPDLSALPRGCAFAPRCAHAVDLCVEREPPLSAVGDDDRADHVAACWLESFGGSGASGGGTEPES